MAALDMFCERCGTRQPTAMPASNRSAGAFARRFLAAVGMTTADGVSAPQDDAFLRLCLSCRGYSCPTCWNEDVGLCQTCAPLPQLELPPVTEQVAPPSTLMQPEPTPAPQIAFEPEIVEVAPWLQVPLEPEPFLIEPEPEPEPAAQVFVAPPPEPEPEPVAEPVSTAPLPAPEREPEPVAEPMAPEPVVEPMAAEPEPATQTEAPPSLAPEPPRVKPFLPLPDFAPRPEVLPPPPPASPPVRPTIAFDSPPPAYMVPRELPAYPPVMRPPAPNLEPSATAAVRPCVSCTLPVSARANFCRRCGSRQD